MNNHHEPENQPAENPPVSVALMQMSESEIARHLNTIQALQADLIRLIPLFNGKEPVEVVTSTQDLLNILSDQINQVLVIKHAEGVQNQSEHLDEESADGDYAAVHRLLSKMQGNKRRLIWAGVE